MKRFQEEIGALVKEHLKQLKSEFEKPRLDFIYSSLFVTDEGKNYSSKVRELHRFATFFIDESIWSSSDLNRALLEMFNEEYVTDLVNHHSYDRESAEIFVAAQRARATNMAELMGSGRREIEWNGFILLAVSVGAYSYCGLLVDHLIKRLLATADRKELFHSLSGRSRDESKSIEDEVAHMIRGDTYNRIKTILKIFGIDEILISQSGVFNVAEYQDAFFALKRWRDEGAHISPQLRAEDFPWGKHMKRMKEICEDFAQARAHIPDENQIEEIMEKTMNDLGPLMEYQKDRLREHLRSGEPGSFAASLDKLLDSNLPAISLLNEFQAIATVYPAVFERSCVVLDSVLSETED